MLYVVSRSWLRLFLYSLYMFSLLLCGLLFIVRLEFSLDKYIGGSHEKTSNSKNIELHNAVQERIGTQNIPRQNKIYNSLSNREVWAGLTVKQDSRKLGVVGDHMMRSNKLEHEDSRTEKSRIIHETTAKNLNPDTTKYSPLDEKNVPLSSSTSTLHIDETTKRPTTTHFTSSKESLHSPSHEAKVYGEPGCPDNPWREAGLTELFQAWINISKYHNIEYVLAGGSLLGAMRNKDIIPYDSDIDIYIDVNYYSVMKRLSEERQFSRSDRKIHLVLQPEFTKNIPVERRKRYDCQGKVTPRLIDQCSFQEPLGRLFKGKLHIDFYHFYERVHYVEEPSNDKLKQYPKKDFYPFKSCGFMGFEASCPNKSWEILRIYFNTDNCLEPIYKCKNGSWVDKNGIVARGF